MLKRFLWFTPLFSIFSIVTLLATGCSKAPTGPPRYETHGIVTYLGKPVDNKVQVVFYATSLELARGVETDEKGHFRFVAVAGDGLPAGEYTVVVRPRAGGYTEIVNYDDYKFPKKYWSKRTTDLKFTIEEGENELKVVLAE